MARAFLTLLVLLVALPAVAQDPLDPLVTVTLSAESAEVPAGQAVTIAITQEIAPGWHTYYEDPGDSGLATTVEWNLPQGWAAGPLQWPEPETFREGPLTTYVYQGSATLRQALTPPADAPPGPVMLTATVDLLVCHDICIPETHTATLDLVTLPPLEERGARGGSFAGAPFLAALAFAFLGGVILNLMPCVFPVLALKGLALVQKRQAHPAWHAAAYAVGVIGAFLAVAAALLALKGAGAAVGWGFHLQEPAVLVALVWLMLAIGLSLAGVFAVSLPFSASQPRATGFAADVATGALITVLATPCLAPFMAAALGYALVQSAPVALAVFAALGAGLAAPYVALTLVPGLGRALPKPGPWMEKLRQALAFPMFATAAWLAWVLARGADGPEVLGYALAGVLVVALAAWLRRLWPVLLLVPLLAFIAAPKGDAFGEPWSPAALEAALEGDGPVFVEMTADWCITCKANHAIALDRARTRDLFAQRGVTYLVGDWTRRDAAITAYLAAFDRQGVPLYVFYPGSSAAPTVLPQILAGPDAVARAIDGAQVGG